MLRILIWYIIDLMQELNISVTLIVPCYCCDLMPSGSSSFHVFCTLGCVECLILEWAPPKTPMGVTAPLLWEGENWHEWFVCASGANLGTVSD